MKNQLKSQMASWYNLVYRQNFLMPQKPRIIPLLFHDIPNLAHFLEAIDCLNEIHPFINPIEFQRQTSQRGISSTQWMLTFDDGYQSSADAINAVDKKFGIKSLFFVCPQWIGMNPNEEKKFVRENLKISDSKDSKAISWQQLVSLERNGHVIGSHSWSHQNLGDKISLEKLQEEIYFSKKILQENISASISCFAFPFGSANNIQQESMKVIKQNYQFCFSGIRGGVTSNDSCYSLFRQSININQSKESIAGEALGVFDIFHSQGRQRLREVDKLSA